MLQDEEKSVEEVTLLGRSCHFVRAQRGGSFYWRMERDLFQMLVRLYTSDKELHSGYVQSNRCAALFIMLWHYDCQCAELKKGVLL